ncbi:hypothetical protein Tco_1156040 [Tanacetum coccineum]
MILKLPAPWDSYDNPNDGIFTNASYDDVGAVADFTNLETIVIVSPIPTSRIHSIHPSTLILRDLKLAVQTRSKVTQISGAHAFEELLQSNSGSLDSCRFALWKESNWKKIGNSKAKPKLGLWYPRVSSFDLEAYSDSDYDGANLDKKSITGEAEYVATTNCFRQVLWIQNQMLDYGFNFMNTKIYIDNESTICIVKNLIFHSKTKYIAIRHHFIRDAYEKKLIQVLRIQTNGNVADLLTKAFNVSRYINVKVAGKPVTISEASIRSDLLFDDADKIDSLNNQAIFDAI